MFNETSYNTLGDLGADKDYAAICAAHPNRPACIAKGFGSGFVPVGGGATGIASPDRPPGSPIPDMGTGGGSITGGVTGGAAGAASDSSSSGGLGSFFSSIPTSYLLIGAAIIAVMVLKK